MLIVVITSSILLSRKYVYYDEDHFRGGLYPHERELAFKIYYCRTLLNYAMYVGYSLGPHP